MENGSRELFLVKDGLATLGAQVVKIRELVEICFLEWASEFNAREMIFPPLISIEELDRIDYFKNFPHLAVLTSRIKDNLLNSDYAQASNTKRVPNDHLVTSEYVLPSAACYNIYLYLSDTTLETPQHITTVAQCFRNESYYKGIKRLLSFTMREIVCVGSYEAVKLHLMKSKEKILDLAENLGLSLSVRSATDPFYDSQGSRTKFQKLFPIKEEFIYKDGLAIASLNFHRDFFGERCNIHMRDEGYAFSGCVGMGLERWIYALLDRFDEDIEAICFALRSLNT